MGQRRRVRRRGAAGVVPIVVLGAAVSLGVVAVTASRFGWRRTKADNLPDQPVGDGPEGTRDAPTAEEAHAAQDMPEPRRERTRFKPAPPRDPDVPRWDTPPAALASAPRDPP
jgi:hypothetical protein